MQLEFPEFTLRTAEYEPENSISCFTWRISRDIDILCSEAV